MLRYICAKNPEEVLTSFGVKKKRLLNADNIVYNPLPVSEFSNINTF